MPIDYEAIARAGGFGKGPTRKQVKAEKKAVHRDVVAETRAEVFALDTVCVVCGLPPGPTDAMHEILSRAQTRGMSPEQRFNRKNCVRVHDGPGYDCHRRITGDLGGGRTRIEFLDPAQGVDGGLRITRGNVVSFYRRGQPMESKVTKPVNTTKRRPGSAKVVTK